MNKPTKEKILEIISGATWRTQAFSPKWEDSLADAIMSLFEPKLEVPEWEFKIDHFCDELDKILPCVPNYNIQMYGVEYRKWLKDFIRSEFKKMADDSSPKLVNVSHRGPDYERGFADASHIYEEARKESLRKRGVE